MSKLISVQELHVVSLNTGNGQKVQILLEELKEIYGVGCNSVVHTSVASWAAEPKPEWFLALNANGMIPVIVDHSESPPFVLSESCAELLYLVRKFDSRGILSFRDDIEYSQCLQWLFFWQGHLYLAVRHFSPDTSPIVIKHFKKEIFRALGVLETHLSNNHNGHAREYIAGSFPGRYSIADISIWPMVNVFLGARNIKAEMDQNCPSLLLWCKRIEKRTAVQLGISKKWDQDQDAEACV
ncbi:glutathione S-transferase [Rhexocercosporidium sp. MPI-PUGE-AT-0058]|nr:glutathione S-transferase [Rhexocercosporidium sp. MPI-PUGE-AT-0058]